MHSPTSRVLAGIASCVVGGVFVAASAIGALADSPSPAGLTVAVNGQTVTASGSLFWGSGCSTNKAAKAGYGIVWNDTGDVGLPAPGDATQLVGLTGSPHGESDGNLVHTNTACSGGTMVFGPLTHTYQTWPPVPAQVCVVAYDYRPGQTSSAWHSIYEADAPGQPGNTDNSILEPASGGGLKIVCQPIAGPPVLGLTKSADPASGTTVARGQQIDYTLTYANNGSTDANGVTITDAIPTGTTYKAGSAACTTTCTTAFANNTVSYTLNLPKNSSGKATFSVTVNNNASNGLVIDNVGQITFNGSTTPSNHTTHTVVVPPVQNPDVTISNVGVPASVMPGDLITYHIDVSNLSAATKATSFNQLLSDSLGPNVAFVSVGYPNGTGGWNNSCQFVAASNSVTCTYTPSLGIGAHAPEITIVGRALTAGVVVTNTAHVDNGLGNPDDLNINNQTASVTTPVGTPQTPPNIVVDKTATPQVNVGEPITYTITVTNLSNAATTNTITVTDTLPTGVQYGSAAGTNWSCQGTQSLTCTWLGTPLAANGGTTTPLTIIGIAQPAAVPSATNTAIAHMGNITVQDSATTVVRVPVNLTLTKSADPASGSDVNRGDAITYSLHYANNGTTDAHGVTITDVIPDGTTYESGSASCTTACTPSVTGNTVTFTLDVLAGTAGTASFTVTVDNNDAAGFIIDNVGQITYNGNTTTSNHTQHQVFVPTGTLTLHKAVSPTKATVGTVLTYTLTASASGNADQTDVVVTDAVPDGTTYSSGSATCSGPNACTTSYDATANVLTWNLGTLPFGTAATMTFEVQVNGPAADGTLPVSIVNVGAIRSNETPQQPSNRVVVPVTFVLGEKVVKPPSTLPFTGFDVLQNALLALVCVGAGLVLLTWPRLQPAYRRTR